MSIIKSRAALIGKTALSLALLFVCAGAWASEYGHSMRADSGGESAASPAAVDIRVSFKLDPRLTRSMYMGERWVSPPTFTMVEDNNGNLVVEARAQALDTRGMPIDLTPEWTPSDPEMVEVTPGQGKQVKITVLRAGLSKLEVSCRGARKTLTINASEDGESLEVGISQ